MVSIWGELRRRHVFKIALAYAVMAWLVILGVAIVFPVLDLPTGAVFVVTAVVVAGFPVALLLAWAYEKTPEGIHRERVLIPRDRARLRRALELCALVALALGLSFVALDHYVLEDLQQEPAAAAGEQLAPALADASSGARWFLDGNNREGYEYGIDDTVSRDDTPSAYLRSRERNATGFATVMRSIPATRYRGQRVRLSGWLSTRDVGEWASLWMRVDGALVEGPRRAILAFDNMQDRPVRGTTDWARYEVVLDVPDAAAVVAFGFMLNGAGHIWADNVALDVVGTAVASTDLRPRSEAIADALDAARDRGSAAREDSRAGPALPVDAAARTIKIGIVSPREGSRLPITGNAHEAAIMLAFERLGPIRIGTTEVNPQFIAWNDEGDPGLSAELALKLAREEGVAAILGPVNSSASAAVLEALSRARIEIPVISSLSTAPNLIVSGRRDRNFFRLIFSDADRMAIYATFIQNEKRRLGEQGYLFLYEDDDYGQGLERALRSNFYSSNVESSAWCDVVTSLDGSHCVDRILDPSFYAAIAEGGAFAPEFVEALGRDRYDNVVFLGTVPGSLALAKGLEARNGRLDYYFVGSTKQLFDEAPTGSVTIGNPVLDPDRAPSARLYGEWNGLLSEFEAKHALDRTDFLSTAYEAGVVLHGALRTILRGQQQIPPLPELRRELLGVLQAQSFDALEPWRRIQFVDGQLSEPPTAPIYRVGRGQIREDPLQARAWVEIDVAPRFNYLEGPIAVRLIGHSVDSARVLLSRLESGRSELIRVRDVAFSGGEARIDFHVFRTGTYRVSLDGVSYAPATAETEIVLAQAYFLSIIVAFFGAWVAVSRERAPLVSRAGRMMLGVFAGFVLTFSSLYGNQIAGWFPFPSFGEEPVINALITGLIGGLIGPYILADVVVSWADILTPVHAKRRKEEPAGVIDLNRQEATRA